MADINTIKEEGTAKKLWMNSMTPFQFAIYSPFIVSLAAGNLDSQSFLLFISQDVHFLSAFVQAYKLAEECAGDDEVKSSIRKLRKRVKDKLKNYAEIVRGWGFELPAEGTPTAATAKYTEFLLAAASGKVEGENVPETPFERIKLAAYTLGAMAPCMRLTASICKEIQGVLDPRDCSHTYKKWVDYYCSENFEESTLQIEELLNEMSITLTGEELVVLEKLYLQAVKLEVEFFCTQPIVQQTIVPVSRMQNPADFHLTLFCDFDMTCTAVDSSAILAEVAIITAPEVDVIAPDTELIRLSSANLRSTWGFISAQYQEEHFRCIESIVRREKVEKFSYEDLSKALTQLADFEKKANSRVMRSRVLKGLNRDAIKRTGELLVFQNGCKEFFRKIAGDENLKTDMRILSCCWCGDLIRSAFESEELDSLQVHSNELAYVENISTGDMYGLVESPAEKLQVFSGVIDYHKDNEQQLSVYIGGSVGDLLCLLKADIGIAIDSSRSLRRVGNHFGVSFVPLFSGVVQKQKKVVEGGCGNWKGQPGTIYTVCTWAEIQAFILGNY